MIIFYFREQIFSIFKYPSKFYTKFIQETSSVKQSEILTENDIIIYMKKRSYITLFKR
jgi:hypothetical protein